MKVALFSFEFPHETSSGGIGTYLFNIKNALKAAGHDVIVFCGTMKPATFEESADVIRIASANWDDFNVQLVPVFAAYHKKYCFDIAEGTDFRGWGLLVKRAFPDLPYVVRLHTPNFLADQLNYEPLAPLARIRFFLSGLLRFRIQTVKPPPDDQYIYELPNLAIADAILTPSTTILNSLRKHIPADKMFGKIPFSFQTGPVAADVQNQKLQLVYAGRLEKRKGIIDLVEAMSYLTAEELEMVELNVAGMDGRSPASQLSMTEFLRQNFIAKKSLRVTFRGKLSHEQTQALIAEGDVFVFPSHWESFGMVIYEAMALGKYCIATRGSAVEEVLQDTEAAAIVDPQNPHQLCEAIRFCLKNRGKLNTWGLKARTFVSEELNPKKLADQQVDFYTKVIALKNSGKNSSITDRN